MKAIYSSLTTILLLMMSSSSSISQTGNTVGLITNGVESYNGYTLFSPSNSKDTYLIDNCGELVNSWQSDYNPAMTSHLTVDGNLLRSGRITNTFNAGGSGGIVQLFDWNNDLIWEGILSIDLQYHQHHDVKALPNGNILVLAWEYNSPNEALQLGREVSKISDKGMWTEMILEIKTIGTDDFQVEWEWHMNDHLVQDIDESKINYGILSEHPELIDINFAQAIDPVDRFHANAIDYNEELDQIVINSRNYNEFYIIDHSTTSEEAATHLGGTSNKGGDILYRYGNPATYERGNENSQKFYGQHGTTWITHGQYKNGIIVFNNGIDRPQGSFSSVEIVVPTRNGNQYMLEDNEAYGPESFDFAYVGTPVSTFFSARLSSASVLPNDNILITDGQAGRIFEINQDKNIVWEYINPVIGQNVASQGDNSPLSDVFASERYSVDYSSNFEDLTATGPIELNSVYNCDLENEEVATNYKFLENVNLVENPIYNDIVLTNKDGKSILLQVFDLFGRPVKESVKSNNQMIQTRLDVAAGHYLLRLTDEANNSSQTLRIIKG